MPERKVKVLAFPYYVDQYDPSRDQTVRIEKTAGRDEVVDFADYDIERGERLDAFYADDDASEGEDTFDPQVAGEAELQAWIEEDKPSVKDVVEASGGDPDTARRLLVAEEGATGGDPRKGVVDGLGSIISRG